MRGCVTVTARLTCAPQPNVGATASKPAANVPPRCGAPQRRAVAAQAAAGGGSRPGEQQDAGAAFSRRSTLLGSLQAAATLLALPATATEAGEVGGCRNGLLLFGASAAMPLLHLTRAACLPAFGAGCYRDGRQGHGLCHHRPGTRTHTQRRHGGSVRRKVGVLPPGGDAFAIVAALSCVSMRRVQGRPASLPFLPRPSARSFHRQTLAPVCLRQVCGAADHHPARVHRSGARGGRGGSLADRRALPGDSGVQRRARASAAAGAAHPPQQPQHRQQLCGPAGGAGCPLPRPRRHACSGCMLRLLACARSPCLEPRASPPEPSHARACAPSSRSTAGLLRRGAGLRHQQQLRRRHRH